MRTRAIVSALSVSALAGCVHTPSSQDVSPDFSFSERSDLGLVVLSGRLSHDCKYGETPRARLALREVFGLYNPAGEVPLEHDSDGPDSQGRVRFTVRELRPGPHEIMAVTFHHGKSTEVGLRIPFQVEEGKAVYLGEVHARLLQCSGFSSFNLQINDAWERDRQLLQSALKNVPPDEVVKTLVPCPKNVACRGPTP
jgi:hypothetical protein